MSEIFESLFLQGDIIEIRCIDKTRGIENTFWKFNDMKAMLEYIGSKNGSTNIYFGVLPRKFNVCGKDEDMLALTTLWVDLDAKDFNGNKDKCLEIIGNFKLQPTFIVDTGNGYHCYWKLKERESINELNFKDLTQLSKVLHKNLQADATYNLGRILRVPGTENVKEEEHKLCCITKKNDIEYSIQDFYKVLDFDVLYDDVSIELDLEQTSKITDEVSMCAILPDTFIERAKSLPDKFINNRSGNDFYLAVKMFEFGLNDKEVLDCFEQFSILEWTAGDKFSERKDYLLKYTLPKAKAKADDMSLLLSKLKLSTNKVDKNSIVVDIVSRLAKKSIVEQENVLNDMQKILKNEFSRTTINKLLKEKKSNDTSKFFVDKNFVPDLFFDFIFKFYSFITVNNEIYIYKNGKYEYGEIFLRSIIVKFLGSLWKSKYSDEIIRLIKDSTVVDYSKLNNTKDLICVKNGMLNIITKQLLPHSPDYYYTQQYDIIFDAKAKNVDMINFVKGIFYKQDLDLVWEFSGYLLMKDINLKKFLILTGKGNNGKSLWLNTLSNIMGKENVSFEPLHKITSNNFSASNLFGKLANINADLESIDLKNVGIIKMLTGDDDISADVKYGKPIYFKNKAKLMFSCNELPNISDIDFSKAFFERVLIINCPNEFVLGHNADPNMKDKLYTEVAKSTWLNLALEGVDRLVKTKTFTISDIVSGFTRTYKYNNDSVTEFVATETEVNINYVVPKKFLYSQYKQWCISSGRYPVSMKTFSKRASETPNKLVDIFLTYQNVPNTACYTGIRAKNYSIKVKV